MTLIRSAPHCRRTDGRGVVPSVAFFVRTGDPLERDGVLSTKMLVSQMLSGTTNVAVGGLTMTRFVSIVLQRYAKRVVIPYLR